MTPIHPFPDESWYLHQIKKLFLHGNVSDHHVETYFAEQVEPGLLSLLSGVLSLDDFGRETPEGTLFEKLILAPFPVLDQIHKRFVHGELQEEVLRGKRKIWKARKEWRVFLGAYEKLVQAQINTRLVERYKIKCCPYCNENYVFNRGKKAGAQLDHFFPQEIYPLFAVSLYNLVPSCPVCNHIKRDRTLGVSPHDRQRGFDRLRISYTPKDGNWIMDAQDLDIVFRFLPLDTDAEFERDMRENMKRLELLDAYQNHRDYVQELVNKAFWYNEAAVEALRNSLPGYLGTEAEMLRMVFGNYVEPKDFLKRPLSRLTRDILLELQIL